MKIHLSTSTSDFDESVRVYDLMKNAITSKHDVVRDWMIEHNERELANKPYSSEEWKEIFIETHNAILYSDAVIIEASIDSFSMGYQSAIAISNKKPLLILSDNRTSVGKLLEGLSSTITSIKFYNDDAELVRFVEEFLKENDLGINDMRFNLYLDREIVNYLKWESFRSGKTKAQLIRDIIKDKISH